MIAAAWPKRPNCHPTAHLKGLPVEIGQQVAELENHEVTFSGKILGLRSWAQG